MNDLVKVQNDIIGIIKKSLRQIVDELCPMPGSAVILGMATDKLPVLMDTRNPKAPNIVVWNKRARQGLSILKVASEYLFRYHKNCGYKASGIEFLVLTKCPDDFGELNNYGFGIKGSTSCIGIVPFDGEVANTVILGLARWIHENKGTKRPVVVMIDGLEKLEKMSEDFKMNLRYIMALGRKRGVYILGTCHKNQFHLVHDWLGGFQAQIFGEDVPDEFVMEEGNKSIHFYTPKTEMI